MNRAPGREPARSTGPSPRWVPPARIGLYHPYPHRMGGSQVVALLLARHLPAFGFEPVMICPEHGNLTAAARDHGIETLICPPGESWRTYGRGANGVRHWLTGTHATDLFRYWRELRAALQQLRIDCLHCNDVRAVVMAAPAGRLAGIPTIWHVHGGPTPGTARWLDPLLALVARNTVFVSDGMLDYWRMPRWLLGRMRVVPNGQDPMVPATPLPRDNDDRLVLAVGALSIVKGQDRLITALPLLLKKVPSVRCWVAGRDWTDGQHENSLYRLAADLGIAPRVEFLGQRGDIPALIATCDSVVIPSRSETFGMVALEAMAQGKPVVAADTGGLRDIVVHRKTGLLVDADNPAALAEAIALLLQNPKVAERMGQAGRERAEEFSAAKMARRFAETYYELLSPPRRATMAQASRT